MRVRLNRQGMAALLKSSEVQADLTARAQRIAAAAGSGHEVTSMVGRTRARASVVTATHRARAREASRRSLTRAIDAGRG